MAKKDVIIRVTVNNSGLCFEDDVDFIMLTVSAEKKIYEIRNFIEEVNKELKEENEDGECGYDIEGWNVTTLMDKVCEKASNGWSWEFLNFEIGIEI